jgi:phage tail-like protein
MAEIQPSSLLQYLPAIYREEPFLGRFLLAFEKLLFGRDDGVSAAGAVPPALEQTIAGIASYFVPRDTDHAPPRQTPDNFLPWLASWTAFSLRADLDLTQQRAFIAKIIPLYRTRGTKRNLEELLQIFTIGTPTVEEIPDGAPHRFSVRVSLHGSTTAVIQRQIAITRALIDLEKPAHTHCDLRWDFPSLQIGRTSHVGVDTLLGTRQEAGEP